MPDAKRSDAWLAVDRVDDLDDRERPSHALVFIDESGDRGLRASSSGTNVLAVASCVFSQRDYVELVDPALRGLKQEFFGRDDFTLHEIDIRKHKGMFTSLGGDQRRFEFEARVRELIRLLPFRLIAVVVDKRPFYGAASSGPDIYELSFRAGFRLLDRLLVTTPSIDRVDLIAETRGSYEDTRLTKVFQRFAAEPGLARETVSYELHFAGKQDVVAGLEVADLVANPIARHALGFQQPLVSFDQIRDKFFGNPDLRSGSSFVVVDGAPE